MLPNLALVLGLLAGSSFHRVVAVHAEKPAPAQGKHFLTNTYGFLRSSGNNVGSAASSMLSIQTSLDDMQKDLTGEYDMWAQKQKSLTGERSRLTNEIAQLQRERLEQRAMGEEKLRLQNTVNLYQAEVQHATDNINVARQKWGLQRAAMDKDNQILVRHLEESQQMKVARVAAAQQTLSQTRDQNRVLQRDIFHLNRQNLQLQATINSQNVSNQMEASKILKKIQVVQTQLHSLQEDMVSQAQLQQQVENAKTRVSVQLSETTKQQKALEQYQIDSVEQLRKADIVILEAKASLNQANKDMIDCQNVDGVNQQIQSQVSQCKMLH